MVLFQDHHSTRWTHLWYLVLGLVWKRCQSHEEQGLTFQIRYIHSNPGLLGIWVLCLNYHVGPQLGQSWCQLEGSVFLSLLLFLLLNCSGGMLPHCLKVVLCLNFAEPSSMQPLNIKGTESGTSEVSSSQWQGCDTPWDKLPGEKQPRAVTCAISCSSR